MKKPIRLKKLIFILCIFGFIIGLFALVHMGLNMRLLGDDYCEAAIVTKFGFFNGQAKAFLTEVPFHGNRFTKTFVATFSSLFPPKTTGYLPLLLLISLGLGLFLLQTAINRLVEIKISGFFKILISLAIVFFTFLLTPTVKQSLYWKSAMLPSTAPIFGTLLLAAAIFTRNHNKWFDIALLFLFAVINGGLSENGAMFQLFSMSITLALCLLFLRRSSLYPSALKKSVTAILGSVAAILIMWSSPSISPERSEMAISLSQTLNLSFKHTVDFYSGFLRSFTVVIAALFLLGLLSYLLESFITA